MNSFQIKEFLNDIVPNSCISFFVFYVLTFNTSFYNNFEKEYNINISNSQKCYKFFYNSIVLMLIIHLLFVLRGIVKFILSALNLYNRILTKSLMNVSDMLLYS